MKIQNAQKHMEYLEKKRQMEESDDGEANDDSEN